MPRFVIEVSNPSRFAPAFVHPGELLGGTVAVTATGVLVLDPSGPRETSRIALTSAQFKAYSYDLEGKAEGKYGCEVSIELHAADADSGERLKLTYAEAAELVAQNVVDDAAALADQAEKEAAWKKATDDREADEKEADAQDEANSVAASMAGQR